MTRICMWGPSAEMDPTPGTPYPLELYGSIDTAHRQNIFDLKYIPHANHPTIVSVAGDSRILVYDVERLPKTTEALETPALDGRVRSAVTRSAGFDFTKLCIVSTVQASGNCIATMIVSRSELRISHGRLVAHEQGQCF